MGKTGSVDEMPMWRTLKRLGITTPQGLFISLVFWGCCGLLVYYTYAQVCVWNLLANLYVQWPGYSNMRRSKYRGANIAKIYTTTVHHVPLQYMALILLSNSFFPFLPSSVFSSSLVSLLWRPGFRWMSKLQIIKKRNNNEPLVKCISGEPSKITWYEIYSSSLTPIRIWCHSSSKLNTVSNSNTGYVNTGVWHVMLRRFQTEILPCPNQIQLQLHYITDVVVITCLSTGQTSTL